MAEIGAEEVQQSEDLGGGIKATRAVDREAEKLQKKVTLPKVPSRTITDAQWLEYARLLTPDMWPQISTMYLYRLKPKIIRQQSDPLNKNYIDKPDRIADLRAYVKQNHSWGRYSCVVNRFLASGSGEQKLVDVVIEIPEEESPELFLDIRELDKNDSSNMGIVNRLRARGMIDSNGNVTTPITAPTHHEGGGAIGSSDLMNMFDKMFNMFAKMSNEQKEELKARLAVNPEAGLSGQIGNILLEKMKQDNPTSMATIVSSVLGAAKEMLPTRQDNSGDVIKMMMDSNKAMLEMQQKHSEQMISILKERTPAEPGEKILDSVDAAMNIMERLNSLSGGGGRKSGWETGLEYAKELGLPLFNAISQIYSTYKMGQSIGATPGQPGAVVKPTGRTISGMEAARNAALIAAGEKPAMYKGEEVNGVAQPPTERPGEVDPELQQILQMMQPAVGPIVKYMADDKLGAELAVDLIKMYGKPSYTMIANYGEEKLLMAMKSVPAFWANFEPYGEGTVKEFLTEFVHYEDFLQEEDQDEERQAQSDSKSKNKKK